MPHLSPQHALSAAALVAMALLCSCATTSATKKTATPEPTAPAAGRFVAPVPQAKTDTWIGSYSGSADMYLAERDLWQRDTPVQLFVQPDGKETLRILGHMDLAASRSSFYIANITPSPTQMLVGQYSEDGPLATHRYDYSLTRSGDTLTGFIKKHQRSTTTDAFEPGDEWHFNVQRRALLDFR